MRRLTLQSRGCKQVQRRCYRCCYPAVKRWVTENPFIFNDVTVLPVLPSFFSHAHTRARACEPARMRMRVTRVTGNKAYIRKEKGREISGLVSRPLLPALLPAGNNVGDTGNKAPERRQSDAPRERLSYRQREGLSH